MRRTRPVPVTSIGICAREALRTGRTGRVEAVFARSFYLRLGDDWLCIGAPSIGRGPINLVLGAPLPTTEWPRVGESARAAPDSVRIGDLLLSLERANAWRPADPPAWTPRSLARGLAAVRATLSRGAVPDGLGACIDARPAPGPTARAAAPAVRSLSAWLATPGASPLPAGAVSALLGLGPGLTPSGDDFLAGALAALRLVGSAHAADALWAAVARNAPSRTGALARAHLAAANRAGLGERLDGMLVNVLPGDERAVRRSVTALMAAPHSSPLDALAGCVAALDGAAAPARPAPA